eukprot:6182218-Pleurochrysis_carterae.AAC.1
MVYAEDEEDVTNLQTALLMEAFLATLFENFKLERRMGMPRGVSRMQHCAAARCCWSKSEKHGGCLIQGSQQSVFILYSSHVKIRTACCLQPKFA